MIHKTNQLLRRRIRLEKLISGPIVRALRSLSGRPDGVRTGEINGREVPELFGSLPFIVTRARRGWTARRRISSLRDSVVFFERPVIGRDAVN